MGAIVRDRESGSTRVRLLQFVPLLAAQGVQTRLIEYRKTGRLGRLGMTFRLVATSLWSDVVLLQKPALSVRALRLVTRLNRCLVVDVDDAVWASSSGDASVAERYGARFDQAALRAVAVIAGSELLKEEIERRTGRSDVVVIRPAVEVVDQPARGPEVRLGWIGSSGNFRDFDADVLAVLETFLRSEGRSLVVVSDRRPPFEMAGLEFRQWDELAEAEELRSMTIGLMPLPDDPRGRGRCGHKALRYLSAGVPCVASAVGVGEELAGRCPAVLAARSGLEWRTLLEDLATDSARTADLGRIGRRWVAENASVEVATAALVDVLHRASFGSDERPAGARHE